MRTQSGKLQYILLGLVVLGSMVFYLASATAVFDSLIHHSIRARTPFDFSDNPRWAVKLLPEALEAGIRPPDVILSVDGQPFNGMARLIARVYKGHAGQVLTVVHRTPEGRTRTARVHLLPLFARTPGISRWLLSIVLIAVFPAFCLLLGYWVVLAKPHDWNAWFFLGVMNVVPVFFGQWGYWPGLLTPFTIFWQIFAIRSMFIALILLGIYFPVRLSLDARYPWIKWLLIVPQILIIPYTILLNYGLLYHVRVVQPYLSAVSPLHFAGNAFAAVSLVVFIAAVIQKLFTVPAADARRRLGVVAAGSLLGLSPVLAILLVSTFTGARFNDAAPSWVVLTLVLLFALFPLSLAYTVIVQRALDVRILLRQGTRYALARGTLWVLQAIVLIYLGYRIVHFSHEPGHRLIRLALPVAFVIVVLFLRLRIARALSLWLDRRFFREAYSAEQVLSDLSEQARGFTETEPLMRTILERIGQTLHVESLSVLLHRGQNFDLRYAQGLPGTVHVSLPENCSIIRALARNLGPARVQREHPDSWLAQASPAEISALNELHAELVLPLPGRSQLVGVMTLGPKLSEEPYSSADRRLLQSVALQTGLAIENSDLIHHLAEAAAQRERMNREIEIAQEVQARLFPQVYPKVEGVDFAGFCRTAQQIGGDYFDFIALENGRLGIAIGDVSGKGISAALLMASIRAALRGLILSGALDPASLMQRLNRILYDSSTNNRFTTFFFAVYDPVTRQLEYVNAGHDTPILLRVAPPTGEAAEGGCGPGVRLETQRLDVGGLVMGIFPEVRYEQGSLVLQPRDVLIAFTDGISEAMTASYEEWGEERLLQAAQTCANLSAEQIVTHLIDAADGFTVGAPQNDDLTMVVVKVTG